MTKLSYKQKLLACGKQGRSRPNENILVWGSLPRQRNNLTDLSQLKKVTELVFEQKIYGM